MNNLKEFYAINPSNNEQLEGLFKNSTAEEVDEAVHRATNAFDIFRKMDKNRIADFLEKVADEILNLGDALLERCHLETALPIERLQGERGRTINQLKLFATVAREGSWVDARIDTSIPDRSPIPKSDIRHMYTPLGPVAIFGASNFPLAFSVAGGDTASALAAGCPVIVKAHPAHPGTSEMVATAFQRAIEVCGMPGGTFSLLQGNKNDVGESLVMHQGIKAVGFTGSFRGGKALFDLANNRQEPIPVFAEMGSTNPVFILPEILERKAEEMASGMVGSIALGVGQFCTKPGLIFIQKSIAADIFINHLTSKIAEVPVGIMLTAGICDNYTKGIQKIQKIDNVDEIGKGLAGDSLNSAKAHVFKTYVETFLENRALEEENFGPSNIVVEAKTKQDILEVASKLRGHLTATIHGTKEDFDEYRELFNILELKVGRVVINGYPTGVEVCHSMVHGGPYPATTVPQTTSVGTNAIKRFARPICFQNYPNTLLPKVLKNENENDIWRMVNGKLSKSKIMN